MIGLGKPSFDRAARSELPMLYRVARRLVLNADEAEDMVQQTLVKAFQAWNRFDGRHLRSWLIRILRNEVLMSRRGPPPPVSLEEAEDGIGMEPPFWDELLWREMSDRLMEAIDDLPEFHRELIQVCEIEGLTYEEAAQALDIPIGTVRSRLFRARVALRQKLSPSLEQILEGER